MNPTRALRLFLCLLTPGTRRPGIRFYLGALIVLYLAISVAPASADEPTFDVRRNFGGAADGAGSVAVGDMDGDGDLDIVTGKWREYGRSVTNAVYLNERGTFTSTVLFSGSSIATLAVGDMDLDGDLDIVVGNDFGSNSVFLNNGGVFTETVQFGRSGTTSVALGDMDGDGDLDIVAAHYSEKSAVYLNNGEVFTESVPFGTPGTAPSAVGDMDGDGDLDIVADTPGQQSAVYLNKGGTFTKTVPFGTSGTTSSAVGDMDGDGDLDIVGSSGPQSTVYRNDGAGSFPPGHTFSYCTLLAVAVGDMDGDGDLDIIAGIRDQPSAVYLNDRESFTITVPFGPSSVRQSVAVGDMDGDGDLDIVAGNEGKQSAVYLNNGVTFTTAVPFGITRDIGSVAVGDMDGDGDLDVVADHHNRPNAVYLNTGGTFTTTASFGMQDYFTSVALGDMDGDGDLDIVTGNYGLLGGLQSVVYLNDGAANFLEKRNFGPAAGYTNSVAVGDLDGDRDLDIVARNDDAQNLVYLNDGAANFPVARNFGTGFSSAGRYTGTPPSNISGVAVGDMDGDGDLDIVASNHGQNLAYLNDGAGNYLTGRNFGTSDPFSVALGDMDSDGDLDIVASRYGQSEVYLNGRAGHKGLQPNNPPVVAIAHPGSRDANFQSTKTVLDSPVISVTYTLSDQESDRVSRVRAWYSQDGGGKWEEAVATTRTLTTNLLPGEHEFEWDTFASEFFGQSDNVVFRLEAYPDLHPMTNTVPGPYQHPYASATTFPFRVRGTQVRVLRNDNAAPGATVYRLPKGQTRDAQPMGSAGMPFKTDNNGYLQGRGVLGIDDGLVALLPITPTSAYTLYYTSAAPTETGLTPHPITASGVQTLTVSAAHPLLLFNLDVSLEWDARMDPQFLSQLEYDLGRTSELLYDWSNGQAALGQVQVYQDREHWDKAHVRIYASNRLRPNAAQGGIVGAPGEIVPVRVPDPDNAAIVYEPGQVRMGAVWNRYGEASGNLGEDWPRALAHELGHYAFFLQDTYLGLDDSGQVIPVRDCPGAMSDPYRDDYSEFFNEASFPAVKWSTACSTTLAFKETGRQDWETIEKFYSFDASSETKQPWLHGTTALAGPNLLPLAVTQVSIITETLPSTTPVEVPIYSMTKGEDGSQALPGSSARAILYQGDDRLIDLGRPTLDQVVARGARSGDELCVYEPNPVLNKDELNDYGPNAARLGCETVDLAARQLALHLRSDWHPQILITPRTAYNINVDVTNVTGVTSAQTLQARLYPTGGAAGPDVQLKPITSTHGVTYRGSFTTTLGPVYEGYVRVWVADDRGSREEKLREAVADFAVGGSPAHVVLHRAPVISTDGQVFLYVQHLDFAKGQFYTIQALARVSNAPEWTTGVGPGYQLTTSTGPPLPVGTSLSISYLADDVPPGEEQWIGMYYSADGQSWQQLVTDLDPYYNMATAPVKGQGQYALMSSIAISLPYAGWNNFAYPVTESRSITQALGSISHPYSAVYGCDPGDTADPWKLYAPTAPDWVNDLKALEFGRGYWINVSQPITQPVTLWLKGSPASAPADSGAQSSAGLASANKCGHVPPATYYGTLKAGNGFSPRKGMTVTAWVNGRPCGQGTSMEKDDKIVFTIDVRAEDLANPGCGAPGRWVTFKAGNYSMVPRRFWDNTQVRTVTLEWRRY